MRAGKESELARFLLCIGGYLMRIPEEYDMKKTLAIFGMIVAAAVVFANGARETRTVEGKLAIVESIPTLSDGKDSWALPPGPFYQVAWEQGLKVGDSLKVEGFVVDGRDFDGPGDGDGDKTKMIVPTRAWANGKELDLSNVARRGRGPGFGDGCGPDGRRDRFGGRNRCDRFDRRDDRRGDRRDDRQGDRRGQR